MPDSKLGPKLASQELGELGERIAERWLRRAGWSILARRWRSGHRDVDLIAQLGTTVTFVEVKTRSGLGFGDPATAVHWRKRRELTRSALVWLDRNGESGFTYRFDIVAVLIRGRSVSVRHIADAFPMHSP